MKLEDDARVRPSCNDPGLNRSSPFSVKSDKWLTEFKIP
jgi:hypothetical protein